MADSMPRRGHVQCEPGASCGTRKEGLKHAHPHTRGDGDMANKHGGDRRRWPVVTPGTIWATKYSDSRLGPEV